MSRIPDRYLSGLRKRIADLEEADRAEAAAAAAVDKAHEALRTYLEQSALPPAPTDEKRPRRARRAAEDDAGGEG